MSEREAEAVKKFISEVGLSNLMSGSLNIGRSSRDVVVYKRNEPGSFVEVTDEGTYSTVKSSNSPKKVPSER